MSEIDRDRSYARTSSELEDTRAKLEECRERLREQEADSETVFATQQQTIQMLRRQLEALQEAVAASNAASSEEGEASPTAVFRRQLHEKNQVIQTLQAGYALFGRTVRPAMVVVAAKGSGARASAADAAAGTAAYAAVDDAGGKFDEQA